MQERWDTSRDMEQELVTKGLPDHPTPQFTCPELSADVLTSPDSRQYTQIYVELLAWFTYSSEMLALVQSQILQLENMQDVLGAETRRVARDLSQGNKAPTKEEMQDRLLLNPEYQDVTLKLQRYQQSKVLMSVKVESIERSLRLISRQVEIRRLDIEQARTGDALGGRNKRDPLTNAHNPPTLGGRR